MNLLKEEQVCELLQVAPTFLRKDRINGPTIPFLRIGPHTVRYEEEKVLAFLRKNEITLERNAAKIAAKASVEGQDQSLEEQLIRERMNQNKRGNHERARTNKGVN